MENKKKNAGTDVRVMEEKKYTETEFNTACNQIYQKLMNELNP